MLIRITIIITLFLCLTSCQQGRGDSTQLTVFAASSLTDAFTELAQAFAEQNPGVEVILNFGGSSQLAAQLREGAVADVFASANPLQMEAAVSAGRVGPSTELPFASNRLIIIVPAANPADIETLADLARPDVALLLAVPGVPVRVYTDQLITALDADFQRRFYANLGSEEDNVRQVAAKIALGEADAGIVYATDLTPDIAALVRHIALPVEQDVIASYLIAPLVDAPHAEWAQAFVAFVRSETGQAVLSRWGFGPSPGK